MTHDRSAAAAPTGVRALDRAVNVVARERGVPERRIRAAILNTVAAQMLPAGVVKGGTGLKLRVGESASRFTPDLDTALREDTREFEEAFATALGHGWGTEGAHFTGRIIRKAKAKPADVPTHYVMQPFELKLMYNGKSWGTVDLEVGHDEINCTAAPDHVIATDLVDLFSELGLPTPGPVPVIALEHQLAQKIHAMSQPGSARAHDLVDTQLLVRAASIDHVALARICEQLFRYRGSHAWPATVTAAEGWFPLYAEAVEGTAALASLDDAIVWVNRLIAAVSEPRA